MVNDQVFSYKSKEIFLFLDFIMNERSSLDLSEEGKGHCDQNKFSLP
jgi:hypothetical protein